MSLAVQYPAYSNSTIPGSIRSRMLQNADWFTRPESLFRTVLWLLGPFFTWFVGRAILRRYEAWEDARSESTARTTLTFLYKALDNPPTLLESLAYIVCFLPLPFFVVALCLTLYFSPPPPHWMIIFPLAPDTAHQAIGVIGLVVSLCCYSVFGVSMFHGIRTAYYLRHGQARYHANYRAAVQRRIDKLLTKFPRLRNELPPKAASATETSPQSDF
jgi:hypothetical protein